MHEVEIAAVGFAKERPACLGRPDAVPTDVWDERPSGEPHHAPRKETQTRLISALLARLEEELHPQADSDHPGSSRGRGLDRVSEARPLEAPRGFGERADAGKENRFRRRDFG